MSNISFRHVARLTSVAALAMALVGCANMTSQSGASNTAAASANPQGAATAPNAPIVPREVKVMIIAMFQPEADAWTRQLQFTEKIKVPGLSADFPEVYCTADGVCLMTTGMGHSNAAASTMAMALSPALDLRKAYFLVAGIAGIDPNKGTIGSATWARYLVDFGLAHEIDAREMPRDWAAGYFGIHAPNPQTKPPLAYRTEVFQINEALLMRALQLSQTAAMDDNDTARAYRAQYVQPRAKEAPVVQLCDTLAGDTYWHGERLGLWASQWTQLMTDGKGSYCTTQQEDNATYEALKRGAAAGKLDVQRVAVLRTASNFDRPFPGQSAYDSLKAKSGGFAIATANLYRAGWPVVSDIVKRWNVWQDGVPSN